MTKDYTIWELDGKEAMTFVANNCKGEEELYFCQEGDTFKITDCKTVKQSIPKSILYKIKNRRFVKI